MKRKSLLIMLLVALFVPLAMNAQNEMLQKKKSTKGSIQLKMRASNEVPSNPMLSQLEPAKEAALKELNNRSMRAANELLTQDFESMSSISTSYSATGWYAYNAGSGNNWTLNTSSTYANSGSKSAQYQYHSSNPANCYLVSSPFSVSSNMTELSVSLYEAVRSSSYAETFEVFFVKASDITSLAGVASATKYNAIASASYTNATYAQQSGTVTNSALAGQSVRVVVHCTSIADRWALYIDDITVTETVEETCPTPTDLNATNITTNSATFSWSGEGESYNVQYRISGGRDLILYEGFEGSLDGWTETNAGDNTGIYEGLPNSGTYMYGFMRNGNNQQYLITPELSNIEAGSVFAFYHMAYNATATIYVGYSTTTNATNQFYWGDAQSVTASEAYDLYAVEIPAGTKYMAIRVNPVTRNAYYFVDDVMVLGPYVENEWTTVYNVTSPYTATGLDSDTEYEWQVQAVCGGDDGESLWSDLDTFTTLDACDAPTGLTTTDITNNSATLSWTAILDAYNVRYRKGFVYDFESATPWAVDNFAPCTTYDGDQYETYGFNSWSFPNAGYTGACIAFNNDNQGSSNMYSHSGNAFGVMFDAGSSSVQSNDWFILPELTIENGDVFSFWGREITDQYGAETINVGIYGSTDGTFSAYLAQNVSVSSTEWTEFSYDLSSYAGQTIKLAINCVSQDIFGFMFDDIFVGNPSNDWSTPVAVNGSTYALTGLDMDTYYTWQVQGADCDGNGGTTSWASDYFTTLDGILVESITADPVTVLVGETASITNLTVLPAEATNPAVTYASNDETIATVDADGVVTGVTVGTTTITIAATDGSNVTTTINVTVNGIDVTGITAENVTVVNGQTATISYTVAPNNATDQSVTFTSVNTAIATVDADGVVTGVSVGETTITITSVSNPDVTATITVTVTSNPNAVQFTVNAPANAAPGETITVEAVLTAPTNGTYEGFTDLLMRIFYDNTAFEYVANSMVYGPVANQAQQYGSQLTPNTTFIANAIQLGINCYDEGVFVTADGVVFSAQFTVLEGTEGSFTFTAQPKDELNFDHEGVAIPYEVTPSTVVVAEPVIEQYFKPIAGWDVGEAEDAFNFYLIASPIGDVDPTDVTITSEDPDKPADVTNMVEGSYDFYYFDHSKDLEWVNYNQGEGAEPGFNLLESGKGYLYANKYDVTLVFTGSAYTTTDGTETVELDYTDGSGVDLPGWNLVGNPFAETAYLAGNCSFYTMSPTGYFEATTNPSIEAMEGIFVEATGENQSVTFTTTQPNSKSPVLNLNLSNGRKVVDRAIVRFDGGKQLSKLQFREGSTKVYIPVEGHDYAVVSCEEMGELPVSFKAEENGSYNLSLSSEEVSFAYLHLIDNMTGADVDLLETPSYSFEAKTTDYANRFKLVFATGDNSNDDNFAFFSNGSFVINNDGEATLQVIDVTGRILSSESINGCTNVNVNAASGVYMLRLINGDNVKVQKVVVK